jgi:hypothetical protein
VRRDDPIRCKLFSGFFCRWTCRSFGHSDGVCENDECMCNEQKLEKYVCGGDVGNGTAHTLCAGWCQFKGRQSGESTNMARTAQESISKSNSLTKNDNAIRQKSQLPSRNYCYV